MSCMDDFPDVQMPSLGVLWKVTEREVNHPTAPENTGNHHNHHHQSQQLHQQQQQQQQQHHFSNTRY